MATPRKPAADEPIQARSPAASKYQSTTDRSRSLFRRWFSRGASPEGHAARYRPSFDALEERTLLAASITGSVWQDLDQDGVRDAEPGLAGVIVFIDDGTNAFTGTQQHVQTNGAGDYAFTGLAAGIVKLGVSLSVGQSLTFPAPDSFQSVTLQDNAAAAGVDFGVLANAVEPIDQQVTSDPSVQQQPSIAVNPTDPTHVVMAYMDYGPQSNGYAGIGIQVSHDSGATWAPSSVPLPASFDEAAGQPIVQFDGAGKVYVSFMAAKFLGRDSNGSALKPGIIDDTTTQLVGFLNKTVGRRAFGMQANNGVFVAGSDDGGLTWNPPVAVSSQRYDQTATTSNTAVGTGSQAVTPVVYPANLFVGKTLIIDEGLASMERVKVTGLTATTFTATFANAHAAGFTISAPVFFDTQPDLAIDNDGNQYVTWTRFYPAGLFPGQPNSSSGSEIMIAVSQNGGQTWTTRFQMVGVTQFSALKDPFTGTTGTAGTEGTGNNQLPRVTVDPDGGVYVSQSAGNRFPVFYSSDAGATFRNPDPGTPPGESPYVTSGYPFGLDDDRYTAIYPSGLSSASFVPGTTLFNNAFRTQAVRDIVADPSRPGAIYAVESVQIINTSGGTLDRGEITFARSIDYGLTWTTAFTVGSDTGNLNELAANLQFRYRGVLNDDNDTRFIGFDGSLQDEVIAGQALPQMSVDANGNLAVIWYDTRRDPANTRLDVYGTVSTDGGLTFSPNNRLTSTSFDANSGVFTDARSTPNFYLGDRIGLAVVNGQAYAAWTGTDSTAANQDIYFSRYSLTPAPLAEDDRFEPNDTDTAATDLGKVTAQRLVPHLGLATPDADWFNVQAGATGSMLIAVTASTPGTTLNLELYDAAGTTVLAGGTPANLGAVAGQHVAFSTISDVHYLIKVTGTGQYSLLMQSLTADFGTSVEGSVAGSVPAGAKSVYRLVTAVDGSLSFSLTSGVNVVGNLGLTILASDGVTVLATGAAGGPSGPGEIETATVSVQKGQVVLIQVSGTPAASGSFTLEYRNFDSLETSGLALNTTQATAEDLGAVTHIVVPTRAIVAGFTDAWYKLTVPTLGSGNQVLDFSAGFAFVQGAGLQMEILDASNSVIGSGEHIRIAVAQGSTLYVHIFALPAAGGMGRGAGLVNLAIDLVASPSIALTFSPALILADGASILTFTITNPNAGSSLTGVGVTDTLPAGLTAANGSSSVGGGTLTITGGNAITLTGASLAPGAQLVFSVLVTGAVAGSYTNTTGMVTYSHGAGNTASAAVTVRPNLTISERIVPRVARRGRLFAYSITVSNLGSAAVSGVTIRDVLPRRAFFLASRPFRYSISAKVLTINVGTIAGNSTKTILVGMYVPFTVPVGVRLKNSITVRAAVSGVVDLDSNISFIVARP